MRIAGRRPVRAAVASLAAVVLALGLSAPGARADGDPASDVLVSQALFVPQDAALSGAQQAALSTALTEARGAGYGLHLAVIAGPGDLGSVGALWRRPESYARFLGQEIALVVHGPLLVVMPDGYGYADIATAGARPRALPASLAVLPAPGHALGPAALGALRRLAAAAGHPLRAISAAAAPRPAGASSALPWAVFALGALLIALAWGLSLRARPPSWGRRAPGT